MNIYTLLGAAALTLTVACDDDPAAGKHKSAASAPVTAPAKAAEGTSVKFDISEVNSAVEFVGAKISMKHDGQFSKFSGLLDLVDGDPSKSRLSVEIQMASVNIQPGKLGMHLKSPDFFDDAKFPTANFVTTSLTKLDGTNEYKVTGNLTLHGVEKSIDFPAKITVGAGSIAVSAEFAINRKDFGIVYAGMADDLIKDDVLLKLSLNPKNS